jgi:predicted DNA-binding protein YlxM (UPF0122 family)
MVAKGKYQQWLTDEGLTLLRGWARDGLSNEQIAHNMGIAEKTLYEWVRKYSEISKAIKKGKEVIDYAVENALCTKAMGGDVAAMIFWLTNRRPEKWQNKRSFDGKVSGGMVVEASLKSKQLGDWTEDELRELRQQAAAEIAKRD